ncbi:cell division protein FtsB [Thioalbus denitrificans]|uniref:Cell division protein FtsB n=1 Tax=Thioalbus denitrificans TaxID=547122 RepID=A0A369BU34_9GAMM|nr:cell division protein FtsB [Thioalbus denitrificans]
MTIKWVIVVLVLVLVSLQARLWFGEGSLAEVWRLRQSVKLQEQTNAEQRERNQVLEAEVRDLKQGLEAIEERARSELGMIREGETFFLLVE